MAGRVRAARTTRAGAAGSGVAPAARGSRSPPSRGPVGSSSSSRIISNGSGLVKIYTRTGDTGETALFDNRRVSKADPRVDAYGEVDELNAWLGLVRSACPEPDIADALVHIQRDLFAVGAQLAAPSEKLAGRVTKAFIGDADVERLETLIDRLERELPPLTRFILAGGATAGASL